MGVVMLTEIAICRGNLELALDLYRKAETYVPDNIKLKERYVLFSSLTTATTIYVVMMLRMLAYCDASDYFLLI